MVFIERVKQSFRRLQWKLTLSYTAVTVGTLLVVVFILGFLLFSSVLVPLDILNSVLSPKGWIQAVNDNLLPQWQYILSQEPIDTRLISFMFQQDEDHLLRFVPGWRTSNPIKDHRSDEYHSRRSCGNRAGNLQP